MGMKIEECLCTKVNYDGKEMEYSYRLTKKMFKNEEVYGIEIERKDNNMMNVGDFQKLLDVNRVTKE